MKSKTIFLPRFINGWRVIQAGFISVILLSVALLSVGAHNNNLRPSQQQSKQSTPAPGTKEKKRLAPLKTSEAGGGSRVTITSDGALSEYSAYRSGDRFYVVIPRADSGGGQAGMRGRGFDDVKVQRDGNDTVLSFRLHPGSRARVEQRFNKLDVVINADEKSTASQSASADTGKHTKEKTPEIAKADSHSNSQQKASPSPEAAAAGSTAASNTDNQIPAKTGSDNFLGNLASGRGSSAVPEASVVPLLNPVVSPSLPSASTSPAVIAGSDEVAQVQPATVPQSATQPGVVGTQTSFGATVANHWLSALILGLMVLGLVGVAVARSLAVRNPPMPLVKGADAKESDPLHARSAGTTQPRLAVGSAALAATGLSAAAAIRKGHAPEAPGSADKAAPEKPLNAFKAESAEREAQALLTGRKFDEAVIGSTDSAVRQVVATELLAALAGTNVERRGRARSALLNHHYLNDLSGDLRGSQAPAQRAAAARSLALIKDPASVPDLIGALSDTAPEVRRAAVEGLAEFKDPAAVVPLETLLKSETNRQVSQSLIKRAIEASVAGATVDAALAGKEKESEVSASPPSEMTLEAAPAGLVEDVTAKPRGKTDRPEPLFAVPLETEVSEEGKGTISATTEKVESVKPPQSSHLSEDIAALGVAGLTLGVAEKLHSKTKSETHRKAEEDAKLKAEAETQRKAEEDARLKAEAETQRKAEEDAKLKAAAETRRKAEEDAKLKAEAETQRKAEEDARLKAEAETKRKAEEDARLKAAAETRRIAEEHAWLKAETETQREAEEEARLKAEAETRRKAEGDARLKAQAESRRKAEDDAKLQAEAESRRKAEEDARPLISVAEKSLELSPDLNNWVDVISIEKGIEPVALEKNLVAVDEEPIFADDEHPAFGETRAVSTEIQEYDADALESGLVPLDEQEFPEIPSEISGRLSSTAPEDRGIAITELGRLGGDHAFNQITAAFDDPTQSVREAAARSLFNISSDRAASFTRALRESTPERRRRIGSALSSSGLAAEALGHLTGESREKTYDAFSLLFLMSKAGEVQPLMRAIEDHPNHEVRLAVIKLLALSGQQEILPAFRRLAVRGSLPTEVRSAVMEAIYQISSQATSGAPSVA